MVNLLQIACKALFQARKLRPVGIKADTEKGDVKRHSSAPGKNEAPTITLFTQRYLCGNASFCG
jgi:hypothetical protein